MDNLKALLGSSYRDDITAAEIEVALNGRKIVDLRDGGYISKDKFDALKNDYETLKSGTADYETLKTEFTTLKTQAEDNVLKERLLKYGVDVKAFKYVKNDLADGTLVYTGDEKAFTKSIETYKQTNPQFFTNIEQPVASRRVITTRIDADAAAGERKPMSKVVNDNIRAALGQKTNVEGDGNI